MKLLVITFTFPPSHHANAKRPYYVVQAMLDAGWQVDVITSQVGVSNISTESLIHPKLRVTRLNDPVEWLAKFLKLKPRWKSRFLLLLNSFIWPEHFRFWAKRALKLAKRHCDDYDRIVTIIFPPSLLLAGRGQYKLGHKWIIDYQESISPYYRENPRRSPLQKFFTPQLRELEKKCLDQCARAIFTAETSRRAYIAQQLVSEEKTILVPHFYDDAAFETPLPLLDGFVIGYFGYFDARGFRTPHTFLEALHIFLKNHPEARNETRFVFYGSWLDIHSELLIKLSLQDVVSINPPVSLNQYLSLVQRCTVLLLLTSSKLNLLMPSKVVEYLGASRPILAFIPSDSEVAGVLKSAGMDQFVCEEADFEAGAAALERLWRQFHGKTLQNHKNQNRQWAASHQIPRYLAAIREI